MNFIWVGAPLVFEIPVTLKKMVFDTLKLKLLMEYQIILF